MAKCTIKHTDFSIRDQVKTEEIINKLVNLFVINIRLKEKEENHCKLRPYGLPYLYSEVEHQAVRVSLCQLIEEIPPCGVSDHLLQPSRSLNTKKTDLDRFIQTRPVGCWENKPTSPSTVKMESAFWGSKCFIRRLLRWFSTRSWT